MIFISRRKIKQNLMNFIFLPWLLKNWVKSRYKIFRLTLKTIFYNNLADFYYSIEIFLEPMFWIVDHFTKVLGPILVGGVILLTGSIVTIVYRIGLPYYLEHYPKLLCFLFVLGHWIFLNVVFHFYRAATIDPGTPPQGILISEAVSVCKKCIAPKPPRTHHCSVCNKCILKMDHHCPWLNNCVGHYNHRHFYMYIVYMSLGSLFIMVFGFEIAFRELWLGGDHGIGLRGALVSYWYPETIEHKDEYELHDGFPVRINGTHMIPIIEDTTGAPMLLDPVPTMTPEEERQHYWYRFSIMYTTMLVSGAFLSLAGLSIWHGRSVSKGETSIEAHINKKETIRLIKIEQIYKNPYDYGTKQNWRLFLGLTNGRSWRHILLPSCHPPLGNGLSWPNSLINFSNHDKVV